MGDFSFLANIYSKLPAKNLDKEVASADSFPEIKTFFSSQDFIEQMLSGINFWGKEKYSDILALTRQVGIPFAEPLIMRLAEEQSISLRRTYLDFLLALGENARDAVIANLTDRRWFVVRNLIIVLRNLNDQSVVNHILSLAEHLHTRVRQEVVKTLQHFNDPEADRLLLHAMDHSDKELRLSAVQLAENSRSPDVFNRLLGFLKKRAMTSSDFELKIAVIRTLAKMKNIDAIPELMRLMRGKNFLHPILFNCLKEEVVRSLGYYPPEKITTILEQIAQSHKGVLQKAAQDTLRTVRAQNR
jgi:HEAT repeat protein